jgi:hypothetical protein
MGDAMENPAKPTTPPPFHGTTPTTANEPPLPSKRSSGRLLNDAATDAGTTWQQWAETVLAKSQNQTGKTRLLRVVVLAELMRGTNRA